MGLYGGVHKINLMSGGTSPRLGNSPSTPMVSKLVFSSGIFSLKSVGQKQCKVVFLDQEHTLSGIQYIGSEITAAPQKRFCNHIIHAFVCYLGILTIQSEILFQQ
jgi:hypothetical protein